MVVFYFPASVSDGVQTEQRERLQSEKIRQDFSPGVWGSPQQAARYPQENERSEFFCG